MSQGPPSVESYDADRLLPNIVVSGTFLSKFRFLTWISFVLLCDHVNKFKK